MPRFFFDFSGDTAEMADDLGCEFESLEAAFLDAYRGMVGMGADMLLEHKDPAALAVQILDESGEVLMVLAYDEVCRRKWAQPFPWPDLRRSLDQQVERSRTLAAEVQAAFRAAQTSVKAVRTVVGQARFMTQAQTARRGW